MNRGRRAGHERGGGGERRVDRDRPDELRSAYRRAARHQHRARITVRVELCSRSPDSADRRSGLHGRRHAGAIVCGRYLPRFALARRSNLARPEQSTRANSRDHALKQRLPLPPLDLSISNLRRLARTLSAGDTVRTSRRREARDRPVIVRRSASGSRRGGGPMANRFGPSRRKGGPTVAAFTATSL